MNRKAIGTLSGLTALTRIFRGSSSLARVRVNERTAVSERIQALAQVTSRIGSDESINLEARELFPSGGGGRGRLEFC